VRQGTKIYVILCRGHKKNSRLETLGSGLPLFTQLPIRRILGNQYLAPVLMTQDGIPTPSLYFPVILGGEHLLSGGQLR
jgi:hypothetical protein